MNDAGLINYLNLIQSIISDYKTEAYLVGGIVRNQLMVRPTKDVDLAIANNPKEIAHRLSEKLKAPMITLEEEREIYRVFSNDGFQFDFARFKGKNIEEDLSQRDFSVNAMAVRLPVRHFESMTQDLIDPYHGKKDIAQKTIRHISTAIYDDDPLRLLRGFRIACQLQFQIDPTTFEAIKANCNKIKMPAVERVREELLLLLESPNAYPYICSMDASGLTSELFPEIDPNRTCALDYYPGKGVWGHSLDGLKHLEWILINLEKEFPENHEKMAPVFFGIGNDTEGHSRAALMKLAILFHDIGKAPTAEIIDGRMRFFMHEEVGAKISTKIAQRLKCSSDFTQGVSRLVQSHMRPGGLAHIPNLTDRAKFRFFRDLGNAALPMLMVSLADRYTYLTEQEIGKETDLHEKSTKELVRWYYQKELEQQYKKPKLINGDLLMDHLGLKPGPTLGKILRDLDEAIALGEVGTKEQAITFAEKWIKNPPDSKEN